MEGNVRKRGKRWYYRFYISEKDGKRRQIERFGGKTRQEALNSLREALNLYHNAGSIPNDENLSANDFFEYWYNNYVKQQLSKNTQTNYRNVLDKYVLPKLGIYKLHKITPATVQEFIDEVSTSTEYKRDGKPLAKQTVSIILMVVKEALFYAVNPLQILHSSPALYAKMPKISEHSKSREDLKIISVKQFEQIIKFFGKDSMEIMPFFISFYTGMRRGEVCGLEWKNVDLVNNEILVHQQMKQYSKTDIRIDKTKTAASYRTIAIGNELVTLLKHQKMLQNKNKLKYGQLYFDSDFVCTKKNGKPITPNSIKYLSGKIHKELGFPFNFHSLRHTHATMLLEAGASPKEVQVRLGHTKIETTLDTYVHLTNHKKRETANLFDNLTNFNI